MTGPRPGALLLAGGLVLLAACGGADPSLGTLSGHLYMVGGPAPGDPQGISGTVVATGPGGRHTAKAGNDGRYSMHLAPGTYTVAGTSPKYAGGQFPCPSDGPVTVVAAQVSNADAGCQIR